MWAQGWWTRLVVLRRLKRSEAQMDANSSRMTQTQSRAGESLEVEMIGDRGDELAVRKQ